MNKSNLISETIDSETYWFGNSGSLIKNDPIIHLLPAFDELLISYRDRTALISDSDNKKAISSNGIFRPIVVVDGKVCGIWRRTTQRSCIVIEADLFKLQDKQVVECIENEANRYSSFINKPIQLIVNNPA
jgi:hypothetical protein